MHIRRHSVCLTFAKNNYTLRYLFLIFVISSTWFSCINDNENADAIKALGDTANYTSIQWIDSVKNFGKIKEGQKLEVSFRFKNTGIKPLVIASVTPGCGCTLVDKPTQAISPGKEGIIKGAFESTGHLGVNNKNITVEANTKPNTSHKLEFTVEVEKAQ